MPDEAARLREYDIRLNKIESTLLVSANDAQHAKKEVEELKRQIGDIKAGINKLLWTGGGIVIVAIVNFILNGGLKIGL